MRRDQDRDFEGRYGDYPRERRDRFEDDWRRESERDYGRFSREADRGQRDWERWDRDEGNGGGMGRRGGMGGGQREQGGWSQREREFGSGGRSEYGGGGMGSQRDYGMGSQYGGGQSGQYGYGGQSGQMGRGGSYSPYTSTYGSGAGAGGYRTSTSTFGHGEPQRQRPTWSYSDRGRRDEDDEQGWFGQAVERVKEFFGKGPKGYKRSDERIKEDVSDRLSEGYLDASDIEVKVDDGEVTLEGTVLNKHHKRLAEDIAESVVGVKDVANRLRVKRSDEMSTDPISGTSTTGTTGTRTGTTTGTTSGTSGSRNR